MSDSLVQTGDVQDERLSFLKGRKERNMVALVGEDWDRPTFRQALDKIVGEHQDENWDGYGALPVSKSTREKGVRFIDWLPFGVIAPKIIPDPDGEISFEWRGRNRIMLSVSVASNGRLSYIARDGINRPSGTLLWIGGPLPAQLLGLLNQFVH